MEFPWILVMFFVGMAALPFAVLCESTKAKVGLFAWLVIWLLPPLVKLWILGVMG